MKTRLYVYRRKARYSAYPSYNYHLFLYANGDRQSITDLYYLDTAIKHLLSNIDSCYLNDAIIEHWIATKTRQDWTMMYIIDSYGRIINYKGDYNGQ
jgi:6-pyruvoyl-tetrahydropterin synthase